MPDQLPFAIGERMTYAARVALGAAGRAAMWVDRSVVARERTAYVLRFDFQASVGPIKAVARTESWLDPLAMAALRFHKHERHPLSNHTERIELYPDQRQWEADDGRCGESPTDAPLDELSFMYFLRTLPLTGDSTYRFERHFEPDRNPISVRVLGRESVTTRAGEFQTILLEMQVRDPRRYRGEGVIRINLSDDARRVPVRVESTIPIVGNGVLSLEAYTAGSQPECSPAEKSLDLGQATGR